jgi:hypothetical protein
MTAEGNEVRPTGVGAHKAPLQKGKLNGFFDTGWLRFAHAG